MNYEWRFTSPLEIRKLYLSSISSPSPSTLTPTESVPKPKLEAEGINSTDRLEKIDVILQTRTFLK